MLDDAGRAMVEQYADVADAAAARFRSRARLAELDELRAIAYIGLCQAAERFPAYQAEHGYPLDDHRYLVAYLSRRINGAILDWARSQDWVTRTQRQRLKALEDCAQPGASIAERAGAAGMTEAEAADALAAEAVRPTNLEEHYEEGRPLAECVADPVDDVESQAAARGILGAAERAARALPWEQQLILMSRYLRGQPLEGIAEALGTEREHVRRLHEAVVITVHDGMLAVSSEGCACERRDSCGCSAR